MEGAVVAVLHEERIRFSSEPGNTEEWQILSSFVSRPHCRPTNNEHQNFGNQGEGPSDQAWQ